MDYFLDKIVPPLLQVGATFIVFALGYKLNEKIRRDERTLAEADRKAEEEKKKEKLKLMLSEELKENYPILLDLTRIDPLEFRQTDNAVRKLSFSVYQEYLNRLDALEPSEIRKILTAYFFIKQVVNEYKEQVAPNRSCNSIHLQWSYYLHQNLEVVETALKFLGYGEQFVIDLLVQKIAESQGNGYYTYIFQKLAEFGNRVVPDLIQMLKSEHERIRSSASEALERIGTPEAVKAVEEYEKRKQDE